MSSSFRVFISKRMKTAQNNIMTVMSWNKKNRLLACGYKNGDIILHLVNESRSQPGTLQLTTSQSLTFHKTAVTAIEWSDSGKSLFSGEESGKIAFWGCPHKTWKNRLTVNSVSSSVKFIKYNRRKETITATFADRSCMYADEGGNLQWSNQTRQVIEFIEFSKDGKHALLATSFGEILVVNAEQGVESSTVPLPSLANVNSEPKIVALEFHPRAEYGLLVAFKSGQIQLMRNDHDSQPIIINVNNMEITAAAWFKSGDVFAVCVNKSGDRSGVHFYSADGAFIRELDVQGSNISSIAFNSNDTKISLCMGDYFCLAQIIPTFYNAFTNNTFLYGYNSAESSDSTLVYFNYILEEKRVHNINNIINISGDDGFFAIFSKENNTVAHVDIVDTIGVNITSTSIPFIPKFFGLSKKNVVCTDQTKVAIWSFGGEKDEVSVKDYNDGIISAIHFCNTNLLISSDQSLISYDVPSFNELRKFQIGNSIEIIKSSCDGKRYSLIDQSGMLQFYNAVDGKIIGPARKDVWNAVWSATVPNLFAASERQKLTIYKNMISEDTMQTLAIIVKFSDLELLTVDIIRLMQDPLEPSKKLFKSYPTKTLQNLKRRLADRPSVTLESTMQFVRQEKIPQLWNELAQILLIENNLPMAEKCYLENLNYQGLQFIKRVRAVKDPKLQRAQILSFFGRFDDAQLIYESIDRVDLAVEMRSTIGDFQRIINIIGSSSSSDETVTKAYESLGDVYVENHDWNNALKAYAKSKNKTKHALALFMTDNYAGLCKLLKKQSLRSTLLPLIGRMFLGIGAVDDAADAFTKCEDTEAALEACIRLNNWKKAIELSVSGKKNKYNEVRNKMLNYANNLIENGQIAAAVDFYRQSGMAVEAAKLMEREGDKNIKANQKGSSKVLVNAKKCFIFAGLQLVEYIKEKFDTTLSSSSFSPSSTLTASSTITTTNAKNNKIQNRVFIQDEDEVLVSGILDNIWRKAEGIHFYLLAHRFMTKKKWKNALICSIRVFDLYSSVVGEDKAAALLAVCALKTGFYQQCSKAFTTLENYDDYTSGMRQKFEDLAIDIFVKHPPVDPDAMQSKNCPKCKSEVPEVCCQCNECGFKIPLCAATGMLITDDDKWQCRCCKHCVSLKFSEDFGVCPFCHQQITS